MRYRYSTKRPWHKGKRAKKRRKEGRPSELGRLLQHEGQESKKKKKNRKIKN
jgi:hypothetical protein